MTAKLRPALYIAALISGTAMPTAAVQDTSLPTIKEEVALKVAPEVDALKKMLKSLNSFQSLQSDFRLIGTNGQSLRGTVSLKKPGFVRFDFGEGAKQLYVSNGKTLSLIDYEIGKVEKVPVKDTPLQVLLSDKIDLSAYKSRVVMNPDGIGSSALMVEDPDKPEMGILTLFFKPQKTTDAQSDDLMVDYWTMRDGQGHLTYVMLENPKKNVALDKSLWTFKDPRGSAKRRR